MSDDFFFETTGDCVGKTLGKRLVLLRATVAKMFRDHEAGGNRGLLARH